MIAYDLRMYGVNKIPPNHQIENIIRLSRLAGFPFSANSNSS